MKKGTRSHWKNEPVVAFLQKLYYAVSFQFHLKQINVSLSMFYHVGCWVHHMSLEMECPVSGTKILMPYCICKKQPTYSKLYSKLNQKCWRKAFHRLHQKCIAVQGAPPSKFTSSEKSYIYEAGYVMQMSQCISLQFIHYSKIALRSEHYIGNLLKWLLIHPCSHKSFLVFCCHKWSFQLEAAENYIFFIVMYFVVLYKYN